MTEGSLFDVSTLETAPGPSASASGSPQTQSLYRKYRPQSFAEDDLFGQDHIVNTLRNAIALDRIVHAYLFCGPRGTGKTTTARLLAKAVNCLDPDPLKRPCNACQACVAINRNATTDVIEIDAASNRGIDDIRDLRERVKYAPTQLSTKFYIIDEAHQITGAAANAFLKTLEEPPPHTKFILATTDPEELLQTIVSRCQRFDFRRINLEAMIACLHKVARLEGIDIEDAAVPVIARHATGSLRDALGILDQVAVYRETSDSEKQPVTVDTVRTVLGVSRNDRVESLVQALADRDAAAGLRAINEAVEAGDDIRQLGRQLVAYLRMLLLHRAGGASEADDHAKLLAERFSLNELAELARAFSDIDVKVKHSAFPQLPLEIAMVNSAASSERPSDDAAVLSQPDRSASSPEDPERQPPPQDVPGEREPAAEPVGPRVSLRDRVRGQAASLNIASPSNEPQTSPPGPAPDRPSSRRNSSSAAVQDAPHRNAGAVSPAPSVGQPRAATGSEITLDTIVELWSKIRADVKAVNRRIEALLQQIDPVTAVGNKIFLVSPYEFHRNRMNSDEARSVVEDVISRLVKQRVQVSCVTREEALAMTTTHRSSEAAPTTAPVPSVALDGERASPNGSSSSPEPEMGVSSPVEVTIGDEGPSQISSPDADAQRITAAKNIFDAEEFDD